MWYGLWNYNGLIKVEECYYLCERNISFYYSYFFVLFTVPNRLKICNVNQINSSNCHYERSNPALAKKSSVIYFIYRMNDSLTLIITLIKVNLALLNFHCSQLETLEINLEVKHKQNTLTNSNQNLDFTNFCELISIHHIIIIWCYRFEESLKYEFKILFHFIAAIWLKIIYQYYVKLVLSMVGESNS